jgi:uncharacterized protein (DUF3084 family)
MKQHLAAPSDLVDVRGIAELNGISAGDGSVTIGAATRHADVATNADVQAHIPALAGWPAASAIRRSAPWARSAARSPTTTRRRITRRRHWASAPPS